MAMNNPTEKTCVNCGCPNDQWQSKIGYNGKYCCKECAEGRECNCAKSDSGQKQKIGAGEQSGSS